MNNNNPRIIKSLIGLAAVLIFNLFILTVMSQTSAQINDTDSSVNLCGNGICDDGEDGLSCSADCAIDTSINSFCGDCICATGEEDSCNIDCSLSCGDGICSDCEDQESCSDDCNSISGQFGSSSCDNCAPDEYCCEECGVCSCNLPAGQTEDSPSISSELQARSINKKVNGTKGINKKLHYQGVNSPLCYPGGKPAGTRECVGDNKLKICKTCEQLPFTASWYEYTCPQGTKCVTDARDDGQADCACTTCGKTEDGGFPDGNLKDLSCRLNARTLLGKRSIYQCIRRKPTVPPPYYKCQWELSKTCEKGETCNQGECK